MTGVDEFFEELRREYLTEAPARLAELRKDLGALRSGEADAPGSLKTRFHRLAGSGGSYGFPAISTISRAAEDWIGGNPSPDEAGIGHLQEVIASLALAFDEAAVELGLPASNPPRRIDFAWRALVLGDSDEPLVARVQHALEDAQYAVVLGSLDTAPASIPVSERPDVALLVPSSPEDGATIAGRWTSAGPSRPKSVLLVAPGNAIDPLLAPFSELDFVVPPERVETELLSFVMALGRSANAPPVALVVDPDEAHSATMQAALEGAGVRVTTVRGGSEARVALGSGTDLVVTEWTLPDTTGPALIRYLRQSGAHPSTPLVVYTAGLSDDERLAAIRAGADDILLKSGSRTHAVQTLLARIERGRRLRARAHRDDVTGLLNHSSMVEELSAAVSFATRTNEMFGLIVLDLDHFRRVNEEHGHGVGDQVLGRSARAVAGMVRSSDVVARMGGEEIGVLVRRCDPENSTKLAEKLRGAIAGASEPVGEATVRVTASAGVACFPEDGTTAAELLRAVDRRVEVAKRAGRDRVGGRATEGPEGPGR